MTDTPADPVRHQFAAARRDLAAALIDRDDEIDLALTALVAGEHVLLVGPPGTAKSLLLDAVARFLDGRRFACLLTKFTQPDELFGPVSLAGLREDRFVRVTAGRLPEADVAFLDEVFKASSAILNTLLEILNDRTFDDGSGVRRPVPLRLCVAASNEWPSAFEGGKELSAVFDRFVFRRSVKPIRTADGRQRLLWGEDLTPVSSATLTPAELDLARQTASALPWSAEAKEALETVLKELAREGVRPGDRRQRKAVTAARASAYLAGAARVEPEHLEVLTSVLWDDPEEQPAVCSRVIARVANPPGLRVTALLVEAEQVLAAVEPRNLTSAATAAAKLGEIERQLSTVVANGRAERARGHVQEQLRKLKLASLDAV